MEKATASTGRKRFSDMPASPTSELSDIERQVSAELRNLRNLKRQDLESKNADIRHMITYYDGMTGVIEERRSKIYDFTLQYLVVLLTAFSLVLSFRSNMVGWLFFVLSALLVIQAIAALWTIVTYELQSRYRYPFLRLQEHGNRWKWFYYGNPFIPKIDRHVLFPRYRDDSTTRPYLEGLKFFTSKYTKERLADEVTDNVQQLYLLIVHNYYKNQFYLSLVRIRLLGLVASLVGAALVLFYWIAYPWISALCPVLKIACR